MTGVLAAIGAAPLAVAGFLALMLRRLRRAGRRDVGAERMVAWWTVVSVVSALLLFACPDPPLWARYALVAPPLAVGFGFVAHRARQHPDALFSPPTARRIHSCRGHR